MIVRITGTVLEVNEDSVVVERDGLAREVLTPHYAVGELAACRGRQVTLHTLEFLEGNAATGGHLTPRLLGFLHVEDRDFFKRFVSVKGIGFRKALKALAEPVGRIAAWIEEGDRKGIARLPGIGPRAAELIVAELKGKMSDLALGGAGAAELTAGWNADQRDALEIMLALGDPRNDAVRWLERAAQLHPDTDAADNWVRAAYKVKTGVES
ncbi:MAG TPA: Holliday junction branch migration protein RuvA [Phycisphaerae bacterium]|nr:Holliday junction branch migration protein RuvA [Phycisphaerae bacterium]